MIDKLHNLADTIIGIDNLRVIDIEFRFIVLNATYTALLFDSSGNKVNPIKVVKEDKTEWLLQPGYYYLACYEIIDDEYKLKYWQNFLVSKEMMGSFKVLKIV